MKLHSIAIFAAIFAAGQSQAALTTTIGDAVPIVINPQFDAFYVTETPVVNGGEYTIHNNTANLTLVGFGVSNPSLESIALIDGTDAFGFVTFSSGQTSDFWEALNLIDDNWGTAPLWDDLFETSSTPQNLFGDMTTAVGTDINVNYFQILDASGLSPGLSGTDFGFRYAAAASVLIGVAVDEFNNTYAFVGGTPVAPVPVPAAGWLMLGALGTLAGFGRRRR
ncbi:MAG: VPLPA-CTERM sorting domain-containing protein [Gammaproteobacteria bacterium]|nr:VPLPA-CTERM sorting domain-containing protein [Gammaproteobacteria bacterium]